MWFRKNENIKDKYMKLFKNINDEEEQRGYEDIRNTIKTKYKKNEKYHSLKSIRLEKERILNNLDQLNSQFPPIVLH